MLSRGLHDGGGEILTRLQLSLLAKDGGRGGLAPEIAHVRHAAAAIGELSRLLHPPELDLYPVHRVVCGYVCTRGGTGPTCVTARLLGEEPPLLREQKVQLFRIGQEAGDNAQRPAR